MPKQKKGPIEKAIAKYENRIERINKKIIRIRAEADEEIARMQEELDEQKILLGAFRKK